MNSTVVVPFMQDIFHHFFLFLRAANDWGFSRGASAKSADEAAYRTVGVPHASSESVRATARTACLAPHAIPAMVFRMFDLTRNEQALVAGFLLIFLLGLGVGHWRESAPLPALPTRTP